MAVLLDIRKVRIAAAAVLAFIFALVFFFNSGLPSTVHTMATGKPAHSWDQSIVHGSSNVTGKYAYVTWLSGTIVGPESEDLDNDKYFVATRILVWQLLHSPKTRSEGIDVVVAVTPSVSDSRRERLRKDGAIVRSVEFLHTPNDGWLKPERDTWTDIMTKLRVWEMVEYEKMLMLDGDMILNGPLDGTFKDAGAHIMTTRTKAGLRKDDEPDLPASYLMGSIGETKNPEHSFPPKQPEDLERPDYFCAGWFMLSPNLELFNYYKALLDLEGRFDARYMEQSLLNYAHRRDGPMPWKDMDYKWNVRHVNEHDVEKGLVSMHEKWWEMPWSGSVKLHDKMIQARWEMEGWYMARDNQGA
ncbi:nucleotide-diphospho-sugar transferase [Clohesyomyces aquaticus]|uniref:Nucleotide-diphospho-sugar transferase n=1 Tax=Clohesyomyces aquaticus TaxID=1231657 RepID=A0A1Y1ZK69_9PLEO|nr:nucleotide-diphospho-sugar transferase [Clohesyomyces aquaticus]